MEATNNNQNESIHLQHYSQIVRPSETVPQELLKSPVQEQELDQVANLNINLFRATRNADNPH
jgi:hypothetical protein